MTGKTIAREPWRLDDVIYPLTLVGLAYLQAFVLLPLLFRWRKEYRTDS